MIIVRSLLSIRMPMAISSRPAAISTPTNVPFIAGEKPEEGVDPEAGEDEGDAQARGVDEQKDDSAQDGLLSGRQGQDGGKDGPMQGVQPKAKAKPIKNAPTRLGARPRPRRASHNRAT